MALGDKNIVITPATGTSGQPTIKFTGGSATASVSTITFKVLDTGPISIEGGVGQLMSIIDTNTGTLFSVNDISGIPSIELLDNGLLKLGQYNGAVWIGTSTNTTTNATVLSVGGPVLSYGMPAFSAYQNSVTALGAASYTKVAFQVKEADSTNAYDNTTNYRYQPLIAGWYQVNASIAFAAGVSEGYIVIRKNGTAIKAGADIGGTCYSTIVSAMVYLNGSTDYIEIFGYSSTALNTSAVQAGTYFQAFYVRP
jgi:hypothetical protein